LGQNAFGNTRALGNGVGVDQLAEPVFSLAHLALGVVDDALDLVKLLLGSVFRMGMTAQTGSLDVLLGLDHAVGREHLAVLALLLGHMALVALHAGFVVYAAGISLGLGVLELDQTGTGDGVLEIEEIQRLVMSQEL